MSHADTETQSRDAEQPEGTSSNAVEDEAPSDEETAAPDSTEAYSQSAPSRLQLSTEARTLTPLIGAAKELVDETRLAVKAEGIGIHAGSADGVGMIDGWIGAESFASFEATEGTLGIKLGRFADILSVADAGELVQIELDVAASALQFDINGVTFTMDLVAPEAIRQAPPVPDIDIPAMVELSDDDFETGVRAADLVSEHVELIVDVEANELRAEVEGDLDSVTYHRRARELVAMDPVPVASKFSLEYLKTVKRALPSGVSKTLRVGETKPLVVRVALPHTSGGAVQFFIAPRVPTDEEQE
jgi:proliferating cell nuclear antigen